jgi:EAL domain-containing protein (putative c-di-GMP-specific phosphodiesterase class I)
MERGTHLFHHVIAMAHEIGLQCIAEGVETEDQLEIMRQYGCRYVQGYIFDKPMPVEDFEKKLREGKYPG